jgi:glycerol kinase
MATTKKYVLALDQGTSSSKAFIFDREGKVVSCASIDFRQIYPRPGWVEHDPDEIWQSQMGAARKAVAQARIDPAEIAALGITNQRETTILWDRSSGKPISNAIVWQCRRTAERCDELKREGFDKVLKARTGLVTDAYFSGTKVEWILDHVSGSRARAEKGEILFGTVDAWLIYNLTGGKVHATDYSNASRTLLFDIHKCEWDQEILRRLRIPASVLPEVRPSSGVVGEVEPKLFGVTIPISGNAGDQQAALFGQTCFRAGQAKNTYGTGCFMLLNTGTLAVGSRDLLTTIAWGIEGRVDYALEGSVFIAGAAVQWLRDELGILGTSSESEAIASSVADSGGVYFVPAFVGLGSPYWDAYARGAIVGLTRGSNRAHLVRATLEAIAYQTRDVLESMKRDSEISLQVLGVDGGAAANNLLCQFQADILGVPVERPAVSETTGLGAAYLAGLATGFWADTEEIARNHQLGRSYAPKMSAGERERLYRGWVRAVERSRNWAIQESESSA